MIHVRVECGHGGLLILSMDGPDLNRLSLSSVHRGSHRLEADRRSNCSKFLEVLTLRSTSGESHAGFLKLTSWHQSHPHGSHACAIAGKMNEKSV